MSLINGNGANQNLPWKKQEAPQASNIVPEKIDTLFLTPKLEEDRNTFEETFFSEKRENEHLYSDKSKLSHSFDFFNGLINNKQYLTTTLDITEEEYDALSCLALGLATQETGMGIEEGYQEEQSGLKGFLRNVGILTLSEHSASSGMTQIKIYDQIENNLDRWHAGILEQRGIIVDGKVTDNLEIPENSAVATIVVLKTIMDNYDNYQDAMNEKNEIMSLDFESQGIKREEALEKGFSYLSDIYNNYQNASDEDKLEIRNSFKQWLKSTDGSTKENPSPDGEEYTEEIQMERLQKALGDTIKLDNDSINYIKYALTSDECQMDMTEYCAYAWNNGTGKTGMQPDRIMAEKIGIIFSDPEIFDYNQYSANVLSLTEKYAQQATGLEDPYSVIENTLKNHTENTEREWLK